MSATRHRSRLESRRAHVPQLPRTHHNPSKKISRTSHGEGTTMIGPGEVSSHLPQLRVQSRYRHRTADSNKVVCVTCSSIMTTALKFIKIYIFDAIYSDSVCKMSNILFATVPREKLLACVALANHNTFIFRSDSHESQEQSTDDPNVII